MQHNADKHSSLVNKCRDSFLDQGFVGLMWRWAHSVGGGGSGVSI